MVQISSGMWNPEAQLFEIRTNGSHFVKNHLKSWQKRQDFEWSYFGMTKARPFENRTIWNPTSKMSGFKCLRISFGRISDPHCSPKKFETLTITLQQGSEKNSTLPRLFKIFAHYSRSSSLHNIILNVFCVVLVLWSLLPTEKLSFAPSRPTS